MGQLVTFERGLDCNRVTMKLKDYLPSSEQEQLTEKLKQQHSSGSSNENTPEPRKGTAEVLFDTRPLFLKLPPPPKKTLIENESEEGSFESGGSGEMGGASLNVEDDTVFPTSCVQNTIQQFEKLTSH